MQTSKLLANRRKVYILDVICNRLYFGEIQEEVLGQCTGQGISEARVESLSVYQRSVPEKKKQAGWLRKCLNHYDGCVKNKLFLILISLLWKGDLTYINSYLSAAENLLFFLCNQFFFIKVGSTTTLLDCFVSLKEKTSEKKEKIFISLWKLFSFLIFRYSNFMTSSNA